MRALQVPSQSGLYRLREGAQEATNEGEAMPKTSARRKQAPRARVVESARKAVADPREAVKIEAR
jgi:hypothetical protein